MLVSNISTSNRIISKQLFQLFFWKFLSDTWGNDGTWWDMIVFDLYIYIHRYIHFFFLVGGWNHQLDEGVWKAKRSVWVGVVFSCALNLEKTTCTSWRWNRGVIEPYLRFFCWCIMINLSIFLIYYVVILGCIRVIPISAVHEMGPGCHCFKHLTVFHVVFIFKLTSCIYIYIYIYDSTDILHMHTHIDTGIFRFT